MLPFKRGIRDSQHFRWPGCCGLLGIRQIAGCCSSSRGGSLTYTGRCWADRGDQARAREELRLLPVSQGLALLPPGLRPLLPLLACFSPTWACTSTSARGQVSALLH